MVQTAPVEIAAQSQASAQGVELPGLQPRTKLVSADWQLPAGRATPAARCVVLVARMSDVNQLQQVCLFLQQARDNALICVATDTLPCAVLCRAVLCHPCRPPGQQCQ